jgi:Mn-containing catalase
MLSFLIARDTMHQNQWMAALEELGGPTGAFPIPNSFPQEQENQEFSYAFLGFQADGSDPVAGRWSQGSSMDGKGQFRPMPMTAALGQKPVLGPAKPGGGAQQEQM